MGAHMRPHGVYSIKIAYIGGKYIKLPPLFILDSILITLRAVFLNDTFATFCVHIMFEDSNTGGHRYSDPDSTR